MGGGGLEDVPDAGEAQAGVVWQEVAALGHEALNGVALEGWVVAACEDVQVGERKAAPRGAQDGKSGGAVGWVEQSAGARGEVEDLLTLAERLDLARKGIASSCFNAATISLRWLRLRTRTAICQGSVRPGGRGFENHSRTMPRISRASRRACCCLSCAGVRRSVVASSGDIEIGLACQTVPRTLGEAGSVGSAGV